MYVYINTLVYFNVIYLSLYIDIRIYINIHIHILKLKFKSKFIYEPPQFDLDGVHVTCSSTSLSWYLYNSALALMTKETFRSRNRLTTILSQLSQYFTPQKTLSVGSRRSVGSTRITKTIRI